MKKLEIKARAKINLTLDILAKRPDGYHELETIMQTIELHDVLVIEETRRGITVTTNHPLLSDAKSNVAYRAVGLLMNTFKINKGVKIQICKNIPVAAGLAGGSTDAAAVLRGLNHLWDLGISKEELANKASLLGSDVPFCIRGGTALAKGRGEILSTLPDIPEIWLILAKPPIEVSTAEIYQNYDSEKVDRRPKTKAMMAAIQTGNVNAIIKNLENVLESVTLRRYPVVLQLKQVMEKCGVCRALMSGSGPTVFGIADSRAEAERIAIRLRNKLPDTFITVSRTWPVE